ncbi:hypothetical protein [Nonomuraea sp. NPDC005501]|uniref:hypothetical protein n=1 Tax=Nonomuraea sp. NPDC005501 TaxID=3156884 RepID=UPI0033A3E5BD
MSRTRVWRAEILASPFATCRRWHHRAVGRLVGGRGRFTPATSDHTELLKRFLSAAQNGDVTELAELPAEDAIAYNDGGGKVRAALRPVTGRANVLAFVAGLMSRYPLEEARLVEANGEPAIWP